MKLLDSTLKYLLMQLLELTLRLQGKLEHHWSNIGFYSSKQSLFFKRLKGWSFQKSPKSLPGLGRNSSWKNWIDVMFFQKCHKSFQTWALLKNLLLLFWMEYVVMIQTILLFTKPIEFMEIVCFSQEIMASSSKFHFE